MAPMRFLAVVVLAVAVSAANDLSDEVKAAEKAGAALPATLKQQWTTRLVQLKKNLTGAKESFLKTIPATVKVGADAFSTLDKVEAKIIANLTRFVNTQNKEATKIAKSYSNLLSKRLSSDSTDEAAIHTLRNTSQAIVNAWVATLGKIQEDGKQVFESTVRKAAADAGKKATNAQLGDQIRVTVNNIGVQLLNSVVQEENANIDLLTHTQFDEFNNYFQKAETALIQLLVAAKNKGSASKSSPKIPKKQ